MTAENDTTKDWDDVRYIESLESCRIWNSQLSQNRRHRIPFFDSHTNVDQFQMSGERNSGLRELAENISEVYRWPQRRWRKRKHPDMPRALMENPKHEEQLLPKLKMFEDHLIPVQVTPAPIEEFNDLSETDDDYRYKGRNKLLARKNTRRSNAGRAREFPESQRSRLKPSIDDDYEAYEPQHECHICGHRVLHKSSLAYHIKNSHPGMPQSSHPGSLGTIKSQLNNSVFNNVNKHGKCDICTNGVDTSTEEFGVLVSCSGACKKSGHPGCVNLPVSIVPKINTYAWECQDCKHCSICSLDENDDKLMFCDICDRGCHLYCLSPPLAEPPQGKWSCGKCA